MIDFIPKMLLSFRMMAPALVTLGLVIISVTNISSASLSMVMPLFPVMMVFYWCIYWPDVMPSWFVFLLGIIYDLIHHLPIGLSSLWLLALRTLITSQRIALLKEPFIVIWGGFSVSCGFYFCAIWVSMIIITGHYFIENALIIHYLMSVLCYPLLHRICHKIHHIVLSST